MFGSSIYSSQVFPRRLKKYVCPICSGENLYKFGLSVSQQNIYAVELSHRSAAIAHFAWKEEKVYMYTAITRAQLAEVYFTPFISI